MILDKTVIISLYSRVQCDEGAKILYITWSNFVFHQISIFIWILTRPQSDEQAGEACEHSKHRSFGYGGTAQHRNVLTHRCGASAELYEVRILDSKPNLTQLLSHIVTSPLLRHANVECTKVNANYKTESNSTHAQNWTQFLRDDSARLFKKKILGITLEMWERAFKFSWHKESCMDADNQGNFLFNSQPDISIIQIYSVIKLYMFRASSLPIIRSFLLYIRHW
jgi:hypothetical protein